MISGPIRTSLLGVSDFVISLGMHCAYQPRGDRFPPQRYCSPAKTHRSWGRTWKQVMISSGLGKDGEDLSSASENMIKHDQYNYSIIQYIAVICIKVALL